VGSPEPQAEPESLPMKIVADENIVALEEHFGGCGELLRLPGRAIRRDHLLDAQALLVRSVTQVNESLLAGTPLRFVGTATAGLDHIDLDYLQRQGIAFCDAAGANANSVVEYVFCALAALAEPRGQAWLGKSVAIIGAGHIGGRLAARLEALGQAFVVCDPLLPPEHFAGRRVDLDEALKQDIITPHPPLTRGGPHPTLHLLDRQRLAALRPEQLLINAARGGVLDNRALRDQLAIGRGPLCVLDAWEGEPAIDMQLLSLVDLGSAHIAGYSEDAKRAGTRLVEEGFRACFGLPPSVGSVGAGETLDLAVSASGSVEDIVNRCLLAAYDIRADHRRLLETGTTADPAGQFDALRKHYPRRLEFPHFRPRLVGTASAAAQGWEAVLGTLGFCVDPPPRVSATALS